MGVGALFYKLPAWGVTIVVQSDVTGKTDLPAEGTGLSEEVITRLQDKATVLTQERKRRGRTIPEGLTPADIIRGFTTLASHPGLHSASIPGILALDVHQSDTSKMVTGGADKNATVFNKDTEQDAVSEWLRLWRSIPFANAEIGKAWD
ncbi:unnamed protein product [Rotaria magnacalcarata]|uniref:Pre-mRNA-processing factor 19 n=1 Tax=Rotaria magnacalcarata TaxID=392030 RepID=A0A816XDX3_9BILA|nr:unnamed protein product [Rotaria magnacalcarata]CAF4162904.1 unnamed protein product [Rotaria magnacalcarata]